MQNALIVQPDSQALGFELLKAFNEDLSVETYSIPLKKC